jgi:hypothetical protein
MHNIFRISISLLIIQMSYSQNYDNLKDFFPLNVGLERLYSYKFNEYLISVVPIDKYLLDSGNVKYVVLDRSDNDSTIIWTVQEQDKITRHEFDGWKDSSYLINKISAFKIIEEKTGFHKLSGNSNFPIWQFPKK